ncbi:hypothetical protein EJ08DRAFT_666381 [Tothia fuscella]|uniref:BZIP domain-containing protein n=1 Tax=Tothia fuscella TaxID=1048955 RepID=A0A9P4TRS1_9PEZI|nr:hypothetical protein EJ08DRAFT_666381 [Tothia fuscella]
MSVIQEQRSEPEISHPRPNGKRRQLTERRREQGRVAQRVYREKQKARRAACSEKSHARHISGCELVNAVDEEIEVAHEPVPDALHIDQFQGSSAHDQFESWDTSFDSLEITQSITVDTPSLGFPVITALSETSSEPANNFMSLNAVSLSIPMDIYIRVQRYSFHAACIENAVALGVTFAQIKYHKCGHDRLVSPWVSQSVYTNLDENAVVPDLSPGEAQKKHDHDLYIDCLPFKDFREKLLALRSAAPKIFDEEDFIRDLDYRDAMQCRGPTPWENKSWEIQTWFLNKWWMITSGESGEMGTCSKWWRMFRGELL